MASLPGRRLPLSPSRRFVCDLMHASRKVPLVSFERRMRLGELADARAAAADPPAWVLLFVKAYALVAARRPELRRAFVPWPRPHLWEADDSVAAVAVEREYGGEPGVFFAHLRAPDKQPLSKMAVYLRGWKTLPVEDVRPFRRCLKYARQPLPLRRFLWAYATGWSGKVKAATLGTFGVSSTAGSGATGLTLVSPLATTLNYEPVGPDGTAAVRLHFDHRVLDGAPAARALAELEDVLCAEVAAEVRGMGKGQPSAGRAGRLATWS